MTPRSIQNLMLVEDNPADARPLRELLAVTARQMLRTLAGPVS
jgi:hypothetical protein